MSSHLELLYCSWRSTFGFHLYWTYKIILLYWKRKGIRIGKHLQCEKLLGLARGNTKKHGNKKSGESRTPIRYNVMIHYHSWLSIARSIHLPCSFHVTIIHGWTVYMPCIRRNHHKTPTLNIQTLYLYIIACTKYTVNEHYCPLNITLPPMWQDLPWKTMQIAWKTASEIIKLKHFAKMYMWITF